MLELYCEQNILLLLQIALSLLLNRDRRLTGSSSPFILKIKLLAIALFIILYSDNASYYS